MNETAIAYPKLKIELKGKALEREIFLAMSRDGFECQLCGKGTIEQLSYHHIIPRGRLHIDHHDNFLTVCTCHVPLHSGGLIIPWSGIVQRIFVDDVLYRHIDRVQKFLTGEYQRAVQ